MIIDSHCHAWNYWPYEPAVPDPETRGTADQLINEMNLNGVDQAVVVCAQIEHNPQDNDYVAAQAEKYPGRLLRLVDLDSEWAPTYHAPGARARLLEIGKRGPLVGFTHYLHTRPGQDAAWLLTEDGMEMLKAAEEFNLIVSISCNPDHQPYLRQAAERFPSVPFLVHHMGYVRLGTGTLGENVRQVLASSRIANIYIKLSGFAYTSSVEWDYPYKDIEWIVRAEYEHFGPQRMVWGSDYPVVKFYMTYKQALEAFRTHCAYVPPEEQAQILGGNMARLLQGRSRIISQ